MWFRWTIGLLIIFRISLFLYYIAVTGDAHYEHLDTRVYVDLAENLLHKHVFAISSWDIISHTQYRDIPLGPEVFRTPGYPLFLAVIQSLGMNNHLWVIFWQEIIYFFTAILFYIFGSKFFHKRVAQIGFIFLMLAPGGIAYPKLILSETLFLPFVVGTLFSIGFYLKKPVRKYLFIAGILMGLGALIRPVLLYFPIVPAGVILFFHRYHRHVWRHISVMLITFVLVISPWLIRNYLVFEQFFFSGQSGNVITHYHLPAVWNAEGVRGYFVGRKHIRKMVAEARTKQEKKRGKPLNEVEFFNLQQKIAINELRKYPKTYLTQWISGTLKAMYVPFAVEVYNVYHAPGAPIPFIELLPDTLQAEKTDALGIPVFSKTSIVGKLFYFVTHARPLYLLSIITSMLTMIFALLGVFYIIQKKDPFLWLIMLANFYFNSVAGPTGYARFRFPIDVFWFIQAIFGGIWCWHICKHFLASLTQRNQTINAN